MICFVRLWSRIAAFSETQLHLYRRDIRLQDYFLALQFNWQNTTSVDHRNSSASSRLVNLAIHAADKISQSPSTPKNQD